MNLPLVRLQKPHFRHYPGEGTPECDEYHPDRGGNSAGTIQLSKDRVPSGVEDDYKEFALQIEAFDFVWSLQIRFPDINASELAGTSLSALARAYLEVKSGQRTHARIGALDVKPGSAATVFVPPETDYVVHALGEWPQSVPTVRWRKKIDGLRPEGVIFRQHRGTWVRLRSDAKLHTGEQLVVVAEAQNPPPASTVLEKHPLANSSRWYVWLISLPESALSELSTWLQKLRRLLVPRPCTIRPITPPRGVSLEGLPIYSQGFGIIFELEAPSHSHSSAVSFYAGQRVELVAGNSLRPETSHIFATTGQSGVARLLVFHQNNTSFDLKFEVPDPANEFRQDSQQFPRLQISVNGQTFDASTHSSIDVPFQKQSPPRVEISVGALGTRLTVMIRIAKNSKRKVISNLDSRAAAIAIAEHLSSASQIVIDADNLGVITVNPRCADVEDEIHDVPRLDHWRSASQKANHIEVGHKTEFRCTEMPLTAIDLLQQRRHAKFRRQRKGLHE